MFLVGLTVYAATKNEQQLGTFYLLTSLVAPHQLLDLRQMVAAIRRSAAMLGGTSP